jgi:hypothetical protein
LSELKQHSKAWYLVPIFLGIIGGLIMYLILKDDNLSMAKKGLYLGIILTVVFVVLGIVVGISSYFVSGLLGVSPVPSIAIPTQSVPTTKIPPELVPYLEEYQATLNNIDESKKALAEMCNKTNQSYLNSGIEPTIISIILCETADVTLLYNKPIPNLPYSLAKSCEDVRKLYELSNIQPKMKYLEYCENNVSQQYEEARQQNIKLEQQLEEARQQNIKMCNDTNDDFITSGIQYDRALVVICEYYGIKLDSNSAKTSWDLTKICDSVRQLYEINNVQPKQKFLEYC